MTYRFLLPLMLSLAAPAYADTSPPPGATPGVTRFDDYPTAARAEYVFACMATNGGTRDALQRCACSIDQIAAILPYDDYQKAETVLRMRRNTGGYLADTFRTAITNQMVRALQEAEAEADVRCF